MNLISLKNIALSRLLSPFRLYRENRIIFRNFISLVLLQGTNFLLPLVTIPYLIRTIGTANFGLVAFAQAFHMYFSLFTDYGFNLSATKQISLSRENKTQLSKIYSEVITCKAILCLISLVLVVLLVESNSKFYTNRSLIYLSFTLVVGQVFLPVWFYQGIERMKFLTYLNLSAKVILTASVFILIKKESDYIYVPLLYASGNIIAGVVSIALISLSFRVEFKVPKLHDIKEQLANGWSVFISIFSIGVIVYSNVFILGFFVPNSILGNYSVAEKITIAVWQIPGLFAQATYPHICKIATNGFKHIIEFFRKVYIPFCAFMIMLCLFVCIFANTIIELASGSKNPEAAFLLQLLSLAPFIIALNVPAYQVLFVYELRKAYTPIFVLCAILNIILNVLLTPFLASIGTVLAVILTQTIFAIALYVILELRYKEYSLMQIFGFWGKKIK